jgi:CRP/FNR family cyclic AMP-dependent transcriptional regulator
VTTTAATRKTSPFDPRKVFPTIDGSGDVVVFHKRQTIFMQGDVSRSVFCIQKGKVRLAVVSKGGKEATIGVLSDGEFFGESCLAGHALRLYSATAMNDCSVLRIESKSMMEMLQREPAFSEMFLQYLVTKNIRYEADLVDQLFNSSEKRLARVLLLLAHFDEGGDPDVAIPEISHETLAEMVGTTRSRITTFMNKFRALGFVQYDVHGTGLRVHRSLLKVVLED